MKKTVATLIAVTGLFLATATTAQAAAILVTTPLTVAFNGPSSTLWDVDGNGTPEFTFTVSLNQTGFDRIFSTPDSTVLIRKTSASFQLANVGPTFTNIGNNGAYSIDNLTSNIINRNTTSGVVGLSSTINPSGFTAFNFTNPGYIAFTFIGQTGSAQAAWAEITFSNAGLNGGFTISEWGFQDAALSGGNLLNVGEGTPVPEPSTYALAFGALALGIAGIRRRRS